MNQDPKELRERLGLTQEAFARLIGVSYVTVNRWENGHAAATAKGALLLPLLERALQRNEPRQVIERLRAASDDLEKVEALMELGPKESER